MSSAFVKYDRTSRLLHWLNAAVIVWATLSGLMISFGAISSTLEHAVSEFNVSLTTLLVPFFIWRVLNRLYKPKPEYAEPLSKTHITVAHSMHLLLYALTAVVLISGLLRMPVPFSVFQLFTVPNLLSDPGLLGDIDTIHTLSCRVLAICVVLHIAAVIKHHTRGENMLSRMT